MYLDKALKDFLISVLAWNSCLAIYLFFVVRGLGIGRADGRFVYGRIEK